MSKLSHATELGDVQMVDVTGKLSTQRVARARGFLRLLPEHLMALDSLPKGDALTTAQIAGIQGGKRCADLIPLCHSVPLSHLEVQFRRAHEGVWIEATARTVSQTGVEMEAYTAVVIAGITLIDMLKGVDPDLTLTDVQLLEKTGGKAPWRRESAS
jgi:cyclic pyranopterin phosphate synthase